MFLFGYFDDDTSLYIRVSGTSDGDNAHADADSCNIALGVNNGDTLVGA